MFPTASRASLLFLLLFLSLLLVGSSARAGNRDGDARALARALGTARHCHGVWLLRGPDARCRELPPPEAYAELYDDVLALAFGANDPPAFSVTGREMRAQRRCQLAIDAAVTSYVQQALRPRRRRHPYSRLARRLFPHGLATIERHCDVEVRISTRGVALPSVGEQCGAALGEPGDRVDASSLNSCLATLLTAWIGRAKPSLSPRRPNIVVILTDDQRFDTIDATHPPDPDGAFPAMPAVLDRLANEGITFRNAFVTNPVCSPSRASFLTGQHVFRHGVFKNAGPTGGAYFDDSSTLATWLQEAGYRTGFFGKYTNDYAKRWDPRFEPPFIPPGWDDWRAFNANSGVDHFTFSMVENSEIVQYTGDEGTYSTDVLASQVLAFIDEAFEIGRPFLVYFSTAAVHHPWTPAPRHEGSFTASPTWLPPSYFEEDVSDKPPWVRALSPWTSLAHVAVQNKRKAQLEMLLAIDEFVDELMDRLEALGLADDTMIVFTSDNGLAWGEHRWSSKACPWEECLRVPLIVRYPRLAPLPRVEEAMALNIDLAPTLAELAGAPLPPERDGRSLVRAIDGTARDRRDDLLFESYSVQSYAGVRERDWKYVEYDGGEYELYDLAKDPWELENLAHDPEQVERMDALRARVRELWPGWSEIPF